MSVSTESETSAPAKPVVVVTKAQQKVMAELVSVAPAAPVVITSNEGYTAAGAQLVQIKANLKQIDAIHEEIVGPLDRVLKDVKLSMSKLKAFFDVPRQKLQGAEVAIKFGMNTYLQAEEAKRAAAQKLLDDAAAKERARLKKLADDAAAQAAAEIAAANKRAADAKAAADKQAAADAKKQADLIAKGKTDAAAAAKVISDQKALLAKQAADTEALKTAKLAAAASVRADLASAKIASLKDQKVTYEAPVAAGVTSRKVWVYEVFQINAVPREYLMVDDKKIKAAIVAGERVIDGLIIKQDMSIVGTGK